MAWMDAFRSTSAPNLSISRFEEDLPYAMSNSNIRDREKSLAVKAVDSRVMSFSIGENESSRKSPWKLLLTMLVLIWVLAAYVNLGAITMMTLESTEDKEGLDKLRYNITSSVRKCFCFDFKFLPSNSCLR